MFKLADATKPIQWPVKINVPVDGGNTAMAEMTAHFWVAPTSTFEALAAQGDEPLLSEVLKGWHDVQDEAGTELPFTPESRDRLLAIPYIRVAMVNAYVEMCSGRERKN